MPRHLHMQLEARIQIDLVKVFLNYNWSETVIMHKIWLPSSKHLVFFYGKLT